MTLRVSVAGSVRVLLPSLYSVSVYSLTASPLFAGAVHSTVIWPPTAVFTRVAVGGFGCAGGAAGVSGADGSLHSEGSGALFLACTRTVYAVPFSSPVHVTDPPVWHCFWVTPSVGAGLISRLTHSMADRSVYVRFFHDTVSSLSPNSSVGGSGFSGFSSGRASRDAGDGSESPTSFVATTVNVYFTLFLSPSKVHVVVLHACSWPVLVRSV